MGKRVNDLKEREKIDNNKKMIQKEIDKKVWQVVDEKLKKAGFKKVEG